MIDLIQSVGIVALGIAVFSMAIRRPGRVPRRIGICGDTLRAVGDGVYHCDLPADHGGWHEVKDGPRWSGPSA